MNRLVTLTAAVLVLALCANAEAAGKKKKNAAPTNTVIGSITSMSDDGKTITVTAVGGKKNKQAAPVELKVTDKTKISYIGIKETDEQKLAVGLFVIVGLDEQDTSTASVIAAAKAAVGKKKKNK